MLNRFADAIVEVEMPERILDRHKMDPHPGPASKSPGPWLPDAYLRGLEWENARRAEFGTKVATTPLTCRSGCRIAAGISCFMSTKPDGLTSIAEQLDLTRHAVRRKQKRLGRLLSNREAGDE